MKVRIPDPFPLPDDELCVEFGRTSYYAHKLEHEFKLFLLAAHILNRIHIAHDTAKYWSLEAFLYDQTLGGLLHVLKQSGGLEDKKLKRDLYRALDARNQLAHTALENYDPMRCCVADRQALIAQLEELRVKIGVPFLVIREFRKLFEQEIGITEEQLQARLTKGNHQIGEAHQPIGRKFRFFGSLFRATSTSLRIRLVQKLFGIFHQKSRTRCSAQARSPHEAEVAVSRPARTTCDTISPR
jgi:hypothetical protein